MNSFVQHPDILFWLMGMSFLATVIGAIYVVFARILIIRIVFGLGTAYSFAMFVYLIEIALNLGR